MPKIPAKKSCAKPTARLLTLKNCESVVPKFGVNALETSPPQVTPQHHWSFELDSLPPPRPQEQHGMPWETTDNISFRAFRRKLPEQVTPESIFTNIALPALSTPVQSAQKTTEWFQARAFAVTASSFGGTSENAETLLNSKTYPLRYGFRGNSYTEWGSMHEKHAEEAFVAFLAERSEGYTLEHPSHLRDPTRPFLGFSPDALLWDKDRTEVDLVEYKCPAARRSGPGHPYSSDKLNVPSRYMAQVQGSMHLLRALYPGVRCVRTWFVVWQAHQFHVTHVPYVDLYASKTVEQAESFFNARFLPACVDAVRTREKSMLTFPTEESCFEFHESSETSLLTSPAPPAEAAPMSCSPTCSSTSSSDSLCCSALAATNLSSPSTASSTTSSTTL